ncbi:GNAT family N-acetyltransferase [Phyllobacterium sp. 628]|uniref:GNAT family N-acetyltransferase n=1 Tax=Phyllobacterium sp. 628 TaxID=2718938 RepID=UPI0021125F1F|nr:GNAT family N-acetyltransferase [Phyllobacterium sp. 628]
MARWLMTSHVRAFYQLDPITPREVAEEYGPLFTGETPDICHISYYGEQPFGYLQCYRNVDYEDWAELPGLDHGISLDLFIGEPAYLGRGFGQRMLKQYLSQIAFPHFNEERFAYISHNAQNVTAIRASEAAGFRPIDEFVEDGDRVILYRFERNMSQ